MKPLLPALLALALFPVARAADEPQGKEPAVAPLVIKTVYVGVEMLPVDGPTRKLFNVPDDSGMLVIAIAPGAPADGVIAQGDILLRAGARPIGYKGQLRAFLSDKKPGDTVVFSLLRGGEPKDVSVKLAAIPVIAARFAPQDNDSQELMRRLLERTRQSAGDNNDFFATAAHDASVADTARHAPGIRMFSRPEGTVVITVNDGKTSVVVVGPEGTVLVKGPLTEALRTKLPEWARTLVDASVTVTVPAKPETPDVAPGA